MEELKIQRIRESLFSHAEWGAEQVLTVYQSLALLDDPEYQDYLFLPFKDETNGKIRMVAEDIWI